MPPRRTAKASAAVVDENAGVDFTQLKKVQQERDVLADQNASLANQLAALTEKLSQVELKNEGQKKQIESLKKTKGFEPQIAALPTQVSSQDGKKEDDNKPKRALTAYLYFSNAHREQTREENPAATFGEIQKILSEKWKVVSPEEQAIFEELAAKDALRYKAEMEQYNKVQATLNHEKSALELLQRQQEQELAMELLRQYQAHQQEVEQLKSNKKEEDPDKPKRAQTAFLFYSTQRRKELAEKKIPFGELAKQIGDEWAKLSDKKKKPFEALAEKEASRYAEEMAAYTEKKQAEQEAAKQEAAEAQANMLTEALKLAEEKNKSDAMLTEAARLLKQKEKDDLALKKEQRAQKKAMKEAQPKRPGSAYVLWGNEERVNIKNEFPELPSAEVTKMLNERWKTVPEDKRAPYQEKAKNLMAQYHVDMAKFVSENPEASMSVQVIDDGANGDTASSGASNA